MKVIDLLNKMANGEEVPKKIKYNTRTWYYKEGIMEYISENDCFSLSNFEFNQLNDEVEIIDNEKWKTIIDFPNYEISTNGNIRTKEYYDSRNHLRQSKSLEKQINNVGYEYVILSNDIEKHKTLTIHRLVAKTFLDDYNDNLEVNHINGIKTDNRVKNLEMTNHCENIKKRYEIGNDGNNYKAVKQYDLDGNYLATYKSSYEAEKMTGIGRTCIGGCCRKEHHTAGGYIWKFKNEEEDKKIEKIEYSIDKDGYLSVNDFREHLLQIINKINEIIDYINGGINGE